MTATDEETGKQTAAVAFDNCEPFKPKKKYPSFWRNLANYFSEYTGATSLHGFQYLGDQKRSIVEKIFWTLVIAASLFICISLILKTYDKWTNSPVIVSFAQAPTPVGRIPFPAVTICSETKSKQRVFNFTDHYLRNLGGNLSDEEALKFSDSSLLCDNHILKTGRQTTDLRVLDFMEELAPGFDETFWACIWKHQNTTCPQLFTTMLSEEGICYTFNMLDRDEIYTNEVYHNKDFLKHSQNSENWTLETGYPPDRDATEETYPFRALTAGAKAGLTVLLKAFEQDLDYVCRGPVQGFKVLLHPPDEVPRVSMQFFRVPLDQEVIVAVKPDMMTTSSGLKDYDPHRRGCYFSHEKQLRYYKRYSQQNCDIECLTNLTEVMCGCVAYHMPHPESTPICGSGNTACMNEAQIAVVAGDNSTDKGCDCLPACTSLTYNAETSQADFNYHKVIQAYGGNVSEFPGIRVARLRLFFKEMQFITSERNELYGITDFMANCGGLLGLFIGFSFVSLIETLYFISLRLVVNLKWYGRHYWSASEDLLENDAYIHTLEENKNNTNTDNENDTKVHE